MLLANCNVLCKAPIQAQKRAATGSVEAANSLFGIIIIMLIGSSQHCWLRRAASHSHYAATHGYAAADTIMAQASTSACALAVQVDQMIAQEESTSTPGETANLQAGQTAANANPNLAG